MELREMQPSHPLWKTLRQVKLCGLYTFKPAIHVHNAAKPVLVEIITQPEDF